MVSLKIQSESDLRHAILLVNYVLKGTAFDKQEKQGIVICVSEVIRNVLMYASNGTGYFSAELHGAEFTFTCFDNGPGITDLPSILEGNFVSSFGLGAGLASVRRLLDDFQISTSAEGTTIVGTKRARRLQ